MLSTIISSNPSAQPPQFPLRLGDPADFLRVREFFKTIPFSEEDICSILDIETLADLHSVNKEQIDWSKSSSEASNLCIRLFLLSEVLESNGLIRHLPSELIQSFLNLDLLRHASDREQALRATVLLYPVRDLMIASDRIGNPFKAETQFFPDIVFPAIHVGTRTFLQIIPQTPAESVLDLCSGTGVAAILASRTSQDVVAADLVPRSNHFARFNCRLNQVEKVEILESDLFSALQGRSFDRIITHPPYVPALTPIAFYRDGGQTGENLIQKIIQQLPDHLNPGGTFFAICAGLDTDQGTFEHRVRNWLGERQMEHDIIFARKAQSTPQEFMRELMWAQQHMESAEITQWQEVFKQIGAYNMSYGVLSIQRRQSPTSAPWTARTLMSQLTSGEGIEWAFHWRQQCLQPDPENWLTKLQPRLSPRLRVTITHSVENGELAPTNFVLSSDAPFYAEARVEPSMATIVSWFDGQKTVGNIYQEAVQKKLIPADYPLSSFVNLIAIFIERGYLYFAQSTT